MQQKNNLNSWKIYYKLLNDLLLVFLLSFVVFWLLGEILSGIASFYFNFDLLIFFIIINLLAINFIGNKINAKFDQQKKLHWTTWAFFFLLFISLLNSILSLGLVKGLAILFLVLISSYLIYKNLIAEC